MRYHPKYDGLGVWLGLSFVIHVIIGLGIWFLFEPAIQWMVDHHAHWGMFALSMMIGNIILHQLEERRRKRFWEEHDDKSYKS